MLNLLILAAMPKHEPTLSPQLLRCEYLVNPVGVDAGKPRLSWVPVAVGPSLKNLRQTAYRVLAASDPRRLTEGKADLWDSGKVRSDASFGIVYRGKRLSPGATAFWKVRLFDQNGEPSGWSLPARWTVGPKWRAEWIQLPLVEKGAGDAEANNGFHGGLAHGPDDVQWVQIDLGKSETIDRVDLFPARPYDFPDTPGFLFPVRFKLEASDDPEFKTVKPLVSDYIRHDFPSPGAEPVKLECENDGRYVRLTVLKLAQRDPKTWSYALAEMRVTTDSGVRSLHRPVTANKSTEVGAWSKARLVDGVTVSHGPRSKEALPATQFRREFELNAKPKRAVLYASALGAYEFHINGKRVGDHILAPEWTDYRDRVQYQGYDVTNLLREGPNALGAILGDVWFAGRIAWYHRPAWGRRPALLAQLEIETADGRRETICTDGTWRGTDTGPIRSSDLLDGEAYDAGSEIPGWDLTGFRGEWRPVKTVRTKAKVVDQPNEPIRIVQKLRPIAITEPKTGIYVVDLGQNMVGWVAARLVGKPGQTATLRYAEALQDDGNVYRENLRGAPQIDTYTFGPSGRGAFEPHFTYHGFRYVEITGARKPRPEDVVGMVFCSSAPVVGELECSDSMLNRLWKNIFWTQRANLMSVPTDCPQRDERLGWMGDVQAFFQTAAFNMDMDGFVAKWSRDLRDAQSADGLFPDYAPWPGPKNSAAGSAAWSDAGVFVPWGAYFNYGDRKLLAEHYASAQKYAEFLVANNPNGLWLNRRGNDFNDWLNGDTLIQEGWPKTGGAVPPEVLATAFMARSLQIVADMAHALGHADDGERYASLAARSREAFCRAYVDVDGRIKGDTQAGYALALSFDLLPVELRAKAAAHMVEAVHKYGDHLSTGIQTTHRLMLELCRWGYADLAYKLLLNRTFPSWGYAIDNGATTIWERWDGYVKGRGFQDPGMNSLNHWALGSAGEFMMKAVGGLWPGDSAGWAHPVIRPVLGGGLQWARASYRSVRGRIACSWRVDDGRFVMEVEVPVGTTATVVVPCAHGVVVSAQGLQPVRKTSGESVYAVGSGSYSFSAG